MKTEKKFILFFVLALCLLLSVSIVLADGPDAFSARGGIPDGTLPQATPLDITEGFDDITTLPGSGWFMQNNSSPAGTTTWFQGNATVFPAHTGATTSYIGANYNNTAGTGTISNWLLTPVANLNDGDEIRFWTRTVAGSIYPDRLEVRMSLNGSSTNVGTLATDVGDFTTLLLSVNPSLTQGGYPTVWTEYVVTVTGAATPTDGRLAFRYFVTNGGPSGANSNYIGIDTFTFTDITPAVPAIAIGKTPDNQNVPFGGDANFTIAITNTGTVTLTNVAVTDALVAACDSTIGTMAPGDFTSYTCIDVGVSATYTNTAVVTSLYNGQTGPTDSDDAVVTVGQPTSVSFSEMSGQVSFLSTLMVTVVALAFIGLATVLYRRFSVK
jgi:uncharacterized repeat protein (TIGR01451 family)